MRLQRKNVDSIYFFEDLGIEFKEIRIQFEVFFLWGLKEFSVFSVVQFLIVGVIKYVVIEVYKYRLGLYSEFVLEVEIK